jgi:Tfp pilus assembly protein PilV
MGRLKALRARHLVLGSLRRRLAAQEGVTLIETVIAAAILVMIVFGVLASLDSAASTTAVNRSRTVAATLAEQDQERMRGLRAVDLSNYYATTKKKVGDVEYTVDSRSEWIRDVTSTSETCTNDGSQADYMRITSTVTSPGVAGKRIKPVQLRSLVTPRVGSFGANQGTLAIQVKNELDKPVKGANVSLTGPAALQDVTNDQGCAVFGHIPTGSYTSTLNLPGYVDPSGKQAATQTATVTSGTTKTVSFQYAQAASVTVSFDSKVNGVVKPATALAVTAANPKVPTGMRVFKAATPQTSITASGLFPFTDGYSFFGGGCPSANPEASIPGYFSSNPGFVNVAAGGSASVTVRLPAFNIQVTRGLVQATAPPYPNAYVRIRSTGVGCNDLYTFNPLNATGTLPDPPALPFGEYTACADDRNSRGLTSDARSQTLTLDNDQPDGLPLTAGVPDNKLWINSGSSTRSPCA